MGYFHLPFGRFLGYLPPKQAYHQHRSIAKTSEVFTSSPASSIGALASWRPWEKRAFRRAGRCQEGNNHQKCSFLKLLLSEKKEKSQVEEVRCYNTRPKAASFLISRRTKHRATVKTKTHEMGHRAIPSKNDETKTTVEENKEKEETLENNQ